MSDETPATIAGHSCMLVLVTVAIVVALFTLATVAVPLDELADKQRVEDRR